MKQSKFNSYEKCKIKNLALEEIQRQKTLKQYAASQRID